MYVAIATGAAEILIFVAVVLRIVIRGSSTPRVSEARFRALAEEHRHVSLRLADLSARVDELRRQVDRILADVE